MSNRISLILHNIRSAHNVGSIMRTADGFGISHIYFTGYTPYPAQKNDLRLPHIAYKISNQITKTALGAENNVQWTHCLELINLIEKLKTDKIDIIALEQDKKSLPLNDYKSNNDIAILLGNEVDGLDRDVLSLCDKIVEIPMFGAKESFNVCQASAIAMYQLKVISQNKH